MERLGLAYSRHSMLSRPASWPMASKDLRRRVGAHIRAARQAEGLSQRELASLIAGPVEGTTISRWERGETMPSWPYMEKIAAALDVTIASLIGDDD